MANPANGRDLVGAGCGYLMNVQAFGFLLKESGDAVDDFIQGSTGTEAGEGMEFFDGRHTAHHVLEARFVGLVVWHVLDGRGAASALSYTLRQSLDGDFFGVADVDDLADGTIRVHEADETFDGVPHIT